MAEKVLVLIKGVGFTQKLTSLSSFKEVWEERPELEIVTFFKKGVTKELREAS